MESDEYRDVLQRTGPLGLPGTVSWASPGVRVLSSEQDGDSETVRISAAEGGELGFARLAWPGYAVSLNGVPQDLEEGPAGLIAVEVPPGTSEVALTFTPPGLHLGLAAMAAGWILALLMGVLHWVTSSRRTRQIHPVQGTQAGSRSLSQPIAR